MSAGLQVDPSFIWVSNTEFSILTTAPPVPSGSVLPTVVSMFNSAVSPGSVVKIPFVVKIPPGVVGNFKLRVFAGDSSVSVCAVSKHAYISKSR